MNYFCHLPWHDCITYQLFVLSAWFASYPPRSGSILDKMGFCLHAEVIFSTSVCLSVCPPWKYLIRQINQEVNKSWLSYCVCRCHKKNIHPVSKETQLFFVDFSWGPGSGSCDPGSWEIFKMMFTPIFIGIHSSPKERQLQKCCDSFETESSRHGR